jgi:hypothetical protein
MTPLRIISALGLLAVCMLLAAGCTIGETQDGKVAIEYGTNHKIESPPVFTTIPIPTTSLIQPAPVQSTLEKNSAIATATVKMPFINITPMNDHYIGDIIHFNGTTNLAPGEKITLWIYAITEQMCNKCQDCSDTVAPCREGIQQTVIVESNISDINTWSWDVNTSQHHFEWGTPYIFEARENYSIFNTTEFELMDKPKSNLTIDNSGNISIPP